MRPRSRRARREPDGSGNRFQPRAEGDAPRGTVCPQPARRYPGWFTRGSEWAMGCRDLREEARSRSSRVLPSNERMGHAHLAAWRARRGARVQVASWAVFRERFQQPVRGSHGPDHDLWTACREGAFGADAARPFPGRLMLVEECEASAVPVRVAGPHFRVDPVFRGASRIERHDIPCKRLVREGLYTGTALMASPREAVDDGCHRKMSGPASLKTFVTGFAGHIAAVAARRAAWRETGNMMKACGSRIRPCCKASSREWGQTRLPSKLLPRRLGARRLPSWPHMEPGIPPPPGGRIAGHPLRRKLLRRPVPVLKALRRPGIRYLHAAIPGTPLARGRIADGVLAAEAGRRQSGPVLLQDPDDPFFRGTVIASFVCLLRQGTDQPQIPELSGEKVTAHPLSACIIASSI